MRPLMIAMQAVFEVFIYFSWSTGKFTPPTIRIPVSGKKDQTNLVAAISMTCDVYQFLINQLPDFIGHRCDKIRVMGGEQHRSRVRLQ